MTVEELRTLVDLLTRYAIHHVRAPGVAALKLMRKNVRQTLAAASRREGTC